MKYGEKKRHDLSYRLAWTLLHSYLSRKFNFEYDTITVDHSPYIVIANHVTNWDPILIGLSFRKSMYYVSTDHVLRMGWKSKLLKFFFSPIARAKSTQEIQTVITIFRRLKENCNICIFAEGNCSYDGVTGEIQRSIGKLVKKSGVALVTYRFSGSFFTFPRWARFMRKGKMSGKLVQTYSPEKLAAMSEDEIYEAIKNDIYVNAYDDQKKNPAAFRGKLPAESLETALYCCPQCRQFATLTSRDDELFCTCGFRVRFNEFGYFEYPEGSRTPPEPHSPPPFTTILDWSKWQSGEINALAERAVAFDSNVPIFSDPDQELFLVARASSNTLLTKGTLCLYNDRISFISAASETVEFPLATIVDMSTITMKTIIFSTKENKVYEVHSEHPRSALKYLEMFKAIKAKE